jgi:hypothetical protein
MPVADFVTHAKAYRRIGISGTACSLGELNPELFKQYA